MHEVPNSQERALRRVADASLSLIASRLVKQLVGFGVEVTLVRLLLPDVWEAVSRFLAFSLTVQVVLQFGFPESLLSLGARAEHAADVKRMLLRGCAALSALCLMFALTILPFGALRTKLLGSSELSVLSAFTLLLCAELVTSLVPSFLISRRFVRQAASFGILSRVPTILGAMAAVTLSASLPAVTLCMALGSCLSAALGLLWCDRLVPTASSAFTGVDFREQLRFAAPVGLTRLAQMLNNQLDKLVVIAALPGAAFGTYYLGAVEVQLIPMLCQSVVSVMLPELIATQSKHEFARLLSTSIRKLSLFALPCFAFLFAFAEQGFVVIYGEEHAQAALPFRIFQLLLLHRFTNYGLLFQALSKPRVPFVSSLLMLGLNLPAGFVLSRLYGSTGAAIATVGSLYVSTVYTFIELKRALGLPWSQILPLRAYGLTLGVSVLSLLPASLVTRSLASHGATLIAAFVVYLVTYFLLGRASGVISKADAAFINDAARLRFLVTEERA